MDERDTGASQQQPRDGSTEALEASLVATAEQQSVAAPSPDAEEDRGASADTALREVLARYWGFDSFRPLQREAMEAVLGRRDSLLVLPTGGGKSLCFQAPALVDPMLDAAPTGARRGSLAVVVSPLISLMKDQVDGLTASGVPAACTHSAQSVEERTAVARGLRAGAYRLLYCSPERLVGEGCERFHELLDECGVAYLAVDEAHCISHWGHDFRPEYRRLGELRRRWPGMSIHAFTATATQRVREDIASQLGLIDPAVLVGSFDRPNLTYRALRRHQAASQLRSILRRHEGEAGIVYCISRKEVERTAESLSKDGLRVLPYHAGLSDEERHRNQEAFLQEEVDIVVATVAFGMGIDRSNVRFVVHLGAPRSVEHYQQEAGRAGRDGLEAECVLLYSPGDFATWRSLLARSGELSDGAQAQLREVERYATQTRCRHRYLVEHFGQGFDRDDCAACDWCKGELEEAAEPVVLAQKILSCVARVRQSFGVGHVIDVLRGRRTERVIARGHDQLSTFGLLADRPIPELRGYTEQLVDQGFLLQHGDPYPVLALSRTGLDLLKGEESCSLFRHRTPPSSRRGRGRRGDREASWEGVDEALFERLREERLAVARERGVPPYVIFHDSTLRHLARLKPTSRAALLEVPGVGAKKADDLGDRFLAAIQD